MADPKHRDKRLYLGVDIGGTKIQASLITEAGMPVQRQRCPSPRGSGPDEILAALEGAINDVLSKAEIERDALTAIGVAVPGVVDPDDGYVVVTPNMGLTDVALGPHLQSRFRVPVVIGNDCNLGALGEKWLGAARDADSAVTMLVGTGIGGGFVRKKRLWRGAREAACEVGHMVMQIDGPLCGCGNRGCFEALASRTAIERDLRQAIADGRTSVLTDLAEGDLQVIRSGMLRRALEADDTLVMEVMHRASEIIGHACLTIRHLIDPRVIVLGGGVLEACSGFMLPIIREVVGSDQLPGARHGGHILLSALGDDAVVLGAVALARGEVGRGPFSKQFAVKPSYRQITDARFGEVTVGGKTYGTDVYIRVDGKAKPRNKALAKELYGSSHTIGPKEMAKVCKGGPQVVFVGTGHRGESHLTEDAILYLQQRSIRYEVLPTAEAVAAYNQSPQRKAALFHVTC